MRLSHSRLHLSAGLCANWHCEHRGAPWQAGVTGKVIRYIAVREFIIRETAQVTGTNRLWTTSLKIKGRKPFYRNFM